MAEHSNWELALMVNKYACAKAEEGQPLEIEPALRNMPIEHDGARDILIRHALRAYQLGHSLKKAADAQLEIVRPFSPHAGGCVGAGCFTAGYIVYILTESAAAGVAVGAALFAFIMNNERKYQTVASYFAGVPSFNPDACIHEMKQDLEATVQKLDALNRSAKM